MPPPRRSSSHWRRQRGVGRRHHLLQVVTECGRPKRGEHRLHRRIRLKPGVLDVSHGLRRYSECGGGSETVTGGRRPPLDRKAARAARIGRRISGWCAGLVGRGRPRSDEGEPTCVMVAVEAGLGSVVPPPPRSNFHFVPTTSSRSKPSVQSAAARGISQSPCPPPSLRRIARSTGDRRPFGANCRRERYTLRPRRSRETWSTSLARPPAAQRWTPPALRPGTQRRRSCRSRTGGRRTRPTGLLAPEDSVVVIRLAHDPGRARRGKRASSAAHEASVSPAVQ